MTFTDRRFRWKNVVILLFRTALSNIADKVAELLEVVSVKFTDKEFHEILSSYVQYQTVKNVSKDLNAETDTCDAHQNEKVGNSAVDKLTRSRKKS